ncbi:peptide-methionine (S)-S-oxide reductase [Rhizobium leguminosarum]|uniref:Peptide methionine sulfoxide reductase MsrA n=1 Tax=Rhizobium leguminosarum TaxID=384 RepID=A0AAE2MMU6_RHILE|nr:MULTISPECIES: peptide-methionine (S)-S-oxide reductase MsrA [Rhizobium]MBB4292089.1 peptide-methionine (S)-S-oxide reductase [Rhizobium leguminosarum]MBB4299637.1 peptide-methionine (S)-S-oxide reductase [Rhizobium leguminosarum]MBB4309973.1 peptide-methionine (S)-S-oxide reductase [Rhizobium leguminosarum]MBB4419286.1 peptide-methionine (S)-S-oxide reductase [Rhizobium leguminosarum]MBB4434089.1 peptide-methionine (S)-S-oxide reductase [Rhizobium esperanzae]
MSTSSRRRSLAALLAATVLSIGASAAGAAEDAVVIPPPAVDETAGAGTETAIFAGGCFWGVQGVFQHVKGVKSAVSGYAGGEAKTAQYETVSTGATGHAESVAVKFDPREVSYGRLLQIFFSVAHNPTQLNFQGPDRGTQYRSVLFVADPEQRKVAERYIDQLDKAHVFAQPIVTKVSETTGFYPAEAYHQDFLTLNPTYPYIVYNDLPKIENLKSLFPADYRSQPVLVRKAKG